MTMAEQDSGDLLNDVETVIAARHFAGNLLARDIAGDHEIALMREAERDPARFIANEDRIIVVQRHQKLWRKLLAVPHDDRAFFGIDALQLIGHDVAGGPRIGQSLTVKPEHRE